MKIRDWSELAGKQMRGFHTNALSEPSLSLAEEYPVGLWEILFEVGLRFRNRFCISRTTEGYANVFPNFSWLRAKEPGEALIAYDMDKHPPFRIILLGCTSIHKSRQGEEPGHRFQVSVTRRGQKLKIVNAVFLASSPDRNLVSSPARSAKAEALLFQ